MELTADLIDHFDAYLIDMYGTIVDIRVNERAPKFWNKIAVYYTANGAQWKGEELKMAYSVFARRLLPKDVAYPDIDLAHVFAHLYEARGVTPTEAQIKETAWFFRCSSASHLRLYPGAKKLLRMLRTQGKVIMLSNGQRLFGFPELELLGITELFDRIYIASDCGCRKPDPTFYMRPVKDFGLDPSRCLVIGNDPYSDGEGARKLGLHAWCMRSKISPPTAPPELYEQPRINLRKLRKILRKHNNGFDAPIREAESGGKPYSED